jgi:hypothetical protein
MRILITSSRMPFALDAIRKLGERGHQVFASDSYEASPGGHSRYLTGHSTTASPSGDPEQFAADVEQIARENEIELVLPMFEEVFYLAAQHERISAVTRLYAPPFRTLAQVHDKGTFQELCDRLELRTPHTVLCHSHKELSEGIARFPRYFARAAFSRGGVGLLTNTGPLAGHLSPADCEPTEANPWLVQEFVEGPMHCTYSALHGERVASHMSYRAPRQWEHSTGIQFLSVDPTDTLPTVEKLGTELDWDGQMSLDFIETDEGLVMIECNPAAFVPRPGALRAARSQRARAALRRDVGRDHLGRPAGPGPAGRGRGLPGQAHWGASGGLIGAAARMAAMDRSVLWRAAVAQLAAVATLSLFLALVLPDSFFDDWGWLSGPPGWLACAGLTAWVLKLEVRSVLLGALLAGIPSALAVLAGVHWLGVAIAVAAFATWCAWLARRPEGVLWT